MEATANWGAEGIKDIVGAVVKLETKLLPNVVVVLDAQGLLVGRGKKNNVGQCTKGDLTIGAVMDLGAQG